MKFKCELQDFLVDELYDLSSLQQKEEEVGVEYAYFILTKTNYAQMRALEKVARVFGVSKKSVHFAGTKDKAGITTQLISIGNPNKKSFEENISFFNEKVGDLSLDFLGWYPSRLNLGDNLGNKFTLLLRDISQKEQELFTKNVELIKHKGALNYFDEQRFGYARNSHKIGAYVLKNNLEQAVYEILTSLPPAPSENLAIFVQRVKTHWEDIKACDKKIIAELTKQAPKFLKAEVLMLRHLHNYKNDFPGAFRSIHKKQRTLYINAYQSYLFNEILTNISQLPEELELFTFETKYRDDIQKFVESLLEKDGLSQSLFELSSSPELRPIATTRITRIIPEELSFGNFEQDELHEGKSKLSLSFSLGSGAYATNIVKQLFDVK